MMMFSCKCVSAVNELTWDRFVDVVRRSRLLPEDRLSHVRKRTPTECTAELIASGELTRFQAQKLLVAQWQGLVLGPFRMLRPLGKGGMGIVYLARDDRPKAERPLVALKILPPRKAAMDPRLLERFEREMDLGRYVPAVPNIARVLTCGRVDGVEYIAMEYAPGETVRAAVAESGPLSVGDAARIFIGVATGLSAAHAVGLIHRDIKPSNIIITPDGEAKVLDFGLALMIGEPMPEDRRIIGGPGYALGTIDYMSPEQGRDASAVTAASDQYSLGCSLFYALAGRPPFPGGTTQEKVQRHRREMPPSIRSIRPDVPVEFEKALNRLMAKRPEDRYVDSYTVADAFRPWSNETMSVIVPAEPVVEVPPDEPILDGEVSGMSRSLGTHNRGIPPWLWTVVGTIVIAAAMMAGFAFNLLRR